MIVLTGESANDLFTTACQAVIHDGIVVHPRGIATTEVLGAHLRLIYPRRRYVDLPHVRILNPAFAAAEALWILSGSDDPWIFGFNGALTRYADDGRLQGAYGPRMRRWGGRIDQLDQVRRLLLDDPDSRQAVIQLYDPERDTRGHRDVPCTLSYRFFVRGGRLHMHTTMRSQDLWLGFPYDVFAATVLHELMAGWLDADLGEYNHHVDSLHLYATDIDAARRLPEIVAPSPSMAPLGVDWDRLPEHLSRVINGSTPPHAETAWTAFAAVMSSYPRWKSGEYRRARDDAAAADGELARALERWYDYLAAAEVHGATETVR